MATGPRQVLITHSALGGSLLLLLPSPDVDTQPRGGREAS